MKKRYWICNTKPENWDICLKDLSWGVDPKSKPAYALDQIKEVDIGDGIFCYVSKKGLIGYFLASSKMSEDPRQLWPDRSYPFRIKLEEVQILSQPICFSEIKGKISNQQTKTLISDGASLLGKSMIPISDQDAECLLKLFEGRHGVRVIQDE